MSALDEMGERNQHEAYQRGFAEGAKQERERVMDELERWMLGKNPESTKMYLDGLYRLHSDWDAKIRSLRQSQSTGGERK